MNKNPSLADVLERRGELVRQADALNAEIQRLNKLVEALEEFAHYRQQALQTGKHLVGFRFPPSIPSLISSAHFKKTTREYILEYLRQTPEIWRTSDQVRDNVSDMKGEDVPMGTVGPTLSKMKNDGEIVRDGNKVALADRVAAIAGLFEKNGEAEASPETDQESDPDQTPNPA